MTASPESPSPLWPGVHVEEVRPGEESVATIVGVATSLALFVGWSARGPADRATRITSFADYESVYGVLDERTLLGYAVQHFFQNGGAEALVVRLVADEERASEADLSPDDLALDPLDSETAADFNDAVRTCFAPGGVADSIEPFNLLCVPGLSDPGTIHWLQAACARKQAFLLVDCTETASASSVVAEAGALKGADASCAAFYFPWVMAPDPLQQGAMRAFPPCGFVAGIHGRADAARGVWKAPAGSESVLTGAVGFTIPISEEENGELSKHAVNCLRTFPGLGNVVWGSRTLAGDDSNASDWKYVPVRRLSLYLERSISRGTQWAVFEPNDEPLWARVRLAIGTFMQALFEQGAFQGDTPRDAWFVKCDRETTTQDDIDHGRLNIVMGFAPLKPAEFVVVRIQQIMRPPQPACD